MFTFYLKKTKSEVNLFTIKMSKFFYNIKNTVIAYSHRCIEVTDIAPQLSYKVCPYILDAQLGLWVSLEHTFTYAFTTNQAE